MQGPNAYNSYKTNSVNFASKEQLLLMLLEGAVKFSKISRQAIADRDIQKAHENIIKTEDIFYELIHSLDVEKGGEWAKSLMQVYDFIVTRLVQANMKKDLNIINEVIPLIEDIRDTWEDAYRISKGIK